MSFLPPNRYETWRSQALTPATLAERCELWPLTERLLQLVWQHQRVQGDNLQTLDGQRVRVLHPGFWNCEAGPDFQRAVIQIGPSWARSGDIEVDLSVHGWHHHGHDRNPAYRNVLLHVVWDAETPALPGMPTLALRSRLDAPLAELALWLGRADQPIANIIGQCARPLQELPHACLSEILHQAAATRFKAKAAQLQARARLVGWEQSLWEGLFGALGYKHNVWAMRRTAELLPLLRKAASGACSLLTLQARLLGVSGLLPDQWPSGTAEGDRYLRRIWDIWWREREQFADVLLPRSLWRLHGSRPANAPPRRLALAAHWIAAGDLPARLENWFATSNTCRNPAHSLLEILQVQNDAFWSRHWSFQSKPLPQEQPLIGAQRLTDLAMNVVLPWFWIRAEAGHNSAWQNLASQQYFSWPRAGDNAILRLACRRLFGVTKLRAIRQAADQQALLQITRDFCDHSDALCHACQFPTFVCDCAHGE